MNVKVMYLIVYYFKYIELYPTNDDDNNEPNFSLGINNILSTIEEKEDGDLASSQETPPLDIRSEKNKITTPDQMTQTPPIRLSEKSVKSYSDISSNKTPITPPPIINRKNNIEELISSKSATPDILKSNSDKETNENISQYMPMNFIFIPPTVKRKKIDGIEKQIIKREYKDYDENNNEIEIEEIIEIQINRKIKKHM